MADDIHFIPLLVYLISINRINPDLALINWINSDLAFVSRNVLNRTFTSWIKQYLASTAILLK